MRQGCQASVETRKMIWEDKMEGERDTTRSTTRTVRIKQKEGYGPDWCGCSTWLVQTLLKVTKANVCANIVEAISSFASARGINTAERSNWGIKARDSRCSFEDPTGDELRYRRTLYTEKLCL